MDIRCLWNISSVVAQILFSASAYASTQENVTWYLATIEDIAVEISAPQEFVPAEGRLDLVAGKLAEILEAVDIKEVPTSENKFKVEISYDQPLADRCRFTTKSQFIRPTTFRRRPQIDWTEVDYVRGSCDADGLWSALEKGFDHATKLASDRIDAQFDSQRADDRTAQAISSAVSCAISGECPDDTGASAASAEAQGGPAECNFDTQCRVGERCIKANSYASGVCARLSPGEGPVTCTFDVDCKAGYSCQKSGGALKGVCLRK